MLSCYGLDRPVFSYSLCCSVTAYAVLLVARYPVHSCSVDIMGIIILKRRYVYLCVVIDLLYLRMKIYCMEFETELEVVLHIFTTVYLFFN